MARTYFKMTMPVFIGLKLGKSGSGSIRHHFHTFECHIIENLWDVLEQPSDLVDSARSWREINETLGGNKCGDIA